MARQHDDVGQVSALQDDVVIPLAALDRGSLPLAGGKAANLGELLRAALPVPPGFCVTTATYALVAAQAGLDDLLESIAATSLEDAVTLVQLAGQVRQRLLAAPIPETVAQAVTAAYHALGGDGALPVAVRSSATAEDLPDASFAGQQDTYLNIVGEQALLDAVRRCWASLWTDRAVSYRATNGIDPRGVQLAVVVQQLVDAAVAGVLFTANPLTGHRHQMVIDASPGLGEAVVSGAVNPDQFVVNRATGEIIERRLGDKRVVIRVQPGGGTQHIAQTDGSAEACLTDAQVRAVAALGARVEQLYGAPQDIEWAIGANGRLWLMQARPITTLFPLPASAPASDDELRVYFSFNVAQGVYQPLTPMAIAMFRRIAAEFATFFGNPPRDMFAGPGFAVESAHRLFLDVTTPLRSRWGRKLLGGAFGIAESRAAAMLQQLIDDPRLAPLPTRRGRLVLTLLRVLARSRIPVRMLRALLQPAAARAQVAQIRDALLTPETWSPTTSAAAHLEAIERLVQDHVVRALTTAGPTFAAGMAAYALAGKLLGDDASLSERQEVLRGLPYNPTTEMDLALWALAQQIRADNAAARALATRAPEHLAEVYCAGRLPAMLQHGLAAFLRAYGHRGVAEIDIGVPRWTDDPAHILGALANYLQLSDPKFAPDVQFRRGAAAAQEMIGALTHRARHRGLVRGLLVGFLLRRTRDLAGLREMPKFLIVTLFARVRERLLAVGEELARAGRLREPQDIFFITLAEARRAVADEDMRALVSSRQVSYAREMGRRHIPRLLLSDGTEPAVPAAATGAFLLSGTPASSGVVSALARVVLDPVGARLEPGEILVAPSTDPGWTPLFLTAGGLVMEMGGPMSHGAVVAREYGIPAVVGVAGATEQLTTGQHITVDGFAGTIALAESQERA